LANFSEEVVQEVLSRTDIVEIISAYLPLKLSGKNYRTLCPFHSEKTPSFMVSQEKQIYHCFGCGEGGNAITFLTKHERFSFPEAVRHLADRAGMHLPEKRAERGTGPSPKLDLYEVNRQACEFFQDQLTRSSAGVKAKDYLKARGISEDAWSKFRLGYAPASWDTLLRHLRTKGKPSSLLEAAGLILPGNRPGAYFDRFRDRLMIPILDTQERVLGFGARAFAVGESKYVNSPTSPIYSKGETLYGLNFAYKKIREEGQALIVEGYFDLISLHLFGWEITVASSGTSLTSGQARLLKRYADRAILLFDSDPAGVKASVRSIEVLLDEGFIIRVAELPRGQDPDSLLRTEGRSAMEDVIDRSWDWLDFIWDARADEKVDREIGEEVHRVREILPILVRMKDRIAAAKYLRKLAEKAGLAEGLLLQEMKEMGKRGRQPAPSLAASPKAFPVEERQALEIALLHSEKKERWAELLALSEISDPQIRRAFTLFFRYGAGEEKQLRHVLCQEADEEVRNLCTRIWAKESPCLDDVESAFADCVRRMKERNEKVSKRELLRKIKEAEESGDSVTVLKLIKEHPSLRRKHQNKGVQ
jgi:DNA primase